MKSKARNYRKKTYLIYVHSMVDAITNSSSTTYIVTSEKETGFIMDFLEEVKKNDFGCGGWGGEMEVFPAADSYWIDEDGTDIEILMLYLGCSWREASAVIKQGNLYEITLDRDLDEVRDAITENFNVIREDLTLFLISSSLSYEELESTLGRWLEECRLAEVDNYKKHSFYMNITILGDFFNDPDRTIADQISTFSNMCIVSQSGPLTEVKEISQKETSYMIALTWDLSEMLKKINNNFDVIWAQDSIRFEDV